MTHKPNRFETPRPQARTPREPEPRSTRRAVPSLPAAMAAVMTIILALCIMLPAYTGSALGTGADGSAGAPAPNGEPVIEASAAPADGQMAAGAGDATAAIRSLRTSALESQAAGDSDEEHTETYTVTWKNYNGTVLETDTGVAWGSMPEYNGATPVRTSSSEGQYQFSNWDPALAPVTADVEYTAQFTTAPIVLCIQDRVSGLAIPDAAFTLENSAGTVVWSATTDASGVLPINRVAEEKENGKGAMFAPGSTYTLRQTATNSTHFVAQGSWTVSVIAMDTFSMKRNYQAGDLSTCEPDGPYGVRFYLYNLSSSRITYDYNYPEGVSGQPENRTSSLGFLSYDGAYTVDVDDPQLEGYEFAGWSIDKMSRTAKKGDVIKLDTVNVAEHTMTACWRNPLNVQALVYSGTDSSQASPVEASRGTFGLAAERTLTFSNLAGVCEAYGQQNAAAKELNTSASYSFVFAEVRKVSGGRERITSLYYDATAHAWQYATSANASWTGIGQGDELYLYYISNAAKVRWVVEGEDGELDTLDESAYPQRDIALTGSWTSTDALLAANDRPIVHGLLYYRSLGFGAADAANASQLVKSGLQSFSLKNGEDGLHFRTGDSGDGQTITGDTVYVVYSTTPPENTVYLGIDNQSSYPYALGSLNVGTADLLALGKVVLVGDNSLQLLDSASSIAAGTTAKLALLGAGANAFTLDGGFSGNIDAGTVVSAAVSGAGKVVRRALVKTEGGSELASTAAITKGTLEADPSWVTVSFDSDLFDLTLLKTWSDDSYPSGYSVDLALYENGMPCAADGSTSAGYYTVAAKDGWRTEVRHLPRRNTYTAAEQAVRITKTNADITGNFQATPGALDSETKTITIENTRANPVCRVGDTEFTTVKEAVEHVVSQGTKSGAVIEMIADYIMAQSGSVTIPAGYDIALTTAKGESAKTITRGFAGEEDLFEVKGKLTITDVTLTGKLGDSILAKTGNGGLVRVAGANAALTVGSGAVLTNARADNGAAIYAQDGATVKLDGARITGNHAVTGGAIGVADDACRVQLTGDTYVYSNQRDNASGQFNLFLDQDSNEVIQIVGNGLGDAAQVGIRVADGESQSIYDAHGKPAKPFATYEDSAKGTLGKLSNDRLGSGPSKYGAASTILERTAVWGETFSFTVNVQWLDDRFNVTGAPDGADVTLKLNGGSTTPADSVKASFDLDANTGWTCTFTGLAKYDGDGKPYEYTVTETKKPADYKQVIFTGDKAVKDNPVTYSAATGDGQKAIVSNYYRYTDLTVVKDVEPGDQGLRSSFAVYRVPKSGANLTRDGGSIRYGGVGSASDLPLALRGGVAEAGDVPADGLFYTDGGNVWRANVDGATVTFHRFYDIAFDEFACDADGDIVALDNDEAWQAGDIVRYDEAGNCKVYGADNAWHAIAPKAAVGYLSFNRQDGYTGAESVGGESANASCTIEGSGSYTFKAEDKKLSSDYYYYVVETSVQETNGKGRTISTSHKIVATYDPAYDYNQLRQTVNVKNTRQDYLSVDKMWPADATTMGTCIFDVYRVRTGDTVSALKDTAKFKEIVKGDASTWEKVGEASLPETNGSWVHVFKDITQEDLANYVYFVRERSAGGVAILNPDVAESSAAVDATYEYDDKVNQITVHNLSDILCKIVDRDGEHPFRSLNDALTYGRTRDNGESNTKFTIQMLRDYSIPAGDIMQLKEEEQITLTTASATEGEYKYHSDDASKTKATITRKSGNTWPFIIVTGGIGNSDTTSITLENIEFDGADAQISYKVGNTTYYNGGFVNAKDASVILRASADDDATGVEMRNGKASSGGGIYAANSTVTVRDAVFEGCASTSTDGNAGVAGGGAIWTKGAEVTTVEDSTFTACTAKRSGGAIASMYQSAAAADEEQTIVTGCTFDSCVAEVNGGGVYSRNALLTVGGENAGDACTFTGSTGWYRGGGICHDNTQAGSVTSVQGCTFDSCTTTAGGTGQNDRHGGAGLNSCADTLSLRGCTFTECDTWVRGGGVLHFNLAASTSELSNCTFESCTASQLGGAGGGGAGLTGINQTLTDCTFNNCTALSGAGGGLDVACFDVDKDAILTSCTFTGCTAGNANGGGICFGGRTLTANDCAFRECKTTASNACGGGIAVTAGGSMEELNLNDCTFRECKSSQASGGAAYTYGTALNVDKTTFTSCVTRSTGGAVCQSPSKNVGLSTATVTQSTFVNCSSETGSGGGMYTSAVTVAVTGKGGETTFNGCTSVNQGGGLRHERSNINTALTLDTCSFGNCRSTNSEGGGAWTYATTATMKSCSFADCTSRSTAGGFYQGIPNNDYVDASSATVAGSAFANCKSETGSGGSFYTSAKTLSITGEKGITTFQNSSSVNAGGSVYHNRNTATTSTSLTQCSFDTSSTSNERGGALCTWAPVLNVKDCSFANCTARSTGGALYQNISNNNYLEGSSTTVTGSTFSHCASANGGGGALYANTKTLAIAGAKKTTTFGDCSSLSAGGSVYHDRSGKDTTTSLAQCSFETSTVSNERGGALCTWATVLNMEDSSFKNCTASSNGGSVCHGPSGSYPQDSAVTAKRCSFTDSTSTGNSGGGLYTSATTVVLDQTPFANCRARQTGGGMYHGLSDNGQIALSKTTFAGCTFKDCATELYSGGGVYTSAQTLSVTGEEGVATFANCTANTEGGGLRHDRSNVASKATLDTCSFKECASTTSSGGGFWTRATSVVLTGAGFKSCTACNNGGGMFHELNSNDQIATSSLRVEKTAFEKCTARYWRGGAIYSNVLAFVADGGSGTTSFEGCSAARDGGAVCHSRSSEGSTMTLTACSFKKCTSTYTSGNESRGGAVYATARSVSVSSSQFAGCTAKNSGGCIFHDPNANTESTTTLTVTDSKFSDGASTTGYGGGIYSQRSAVTLTSTTIKNCSATHGGGLAQASSETRPVVLDACAVKGNSATTRGGGVYFDSNNSIALRNGTRVTGNTLGNATVENGAGIYLLQDRNQATLVLGTEGVTEDTITVYDNKTSEGEQSNVRLIRSTWDNKAQRWYDRNTSVSLLSSLVKESAGSTGSIGVCNPGPANTQFGLEDVPGHLGMEYIVSDIDTLRGKLDPTDHEELKIIWYAPPVCKITDKTGYPLRYGDNKVAAFATLKEAFEVLNTLQNGYLKDSNGVAFDPGDTSREIHIEMLVSDYKLEASMPELRRNVIMTTASPGKTEYDYPLSATSETCTITRGAKATGSMFTVGSGTELTVRSIVLDGGSKGESPQTPQVNGGIIHGKTDAHVVLGKGCVLQNSAVGDGCNGGAVYMTGTSDASKPSLVMERDAAVTGCSAANGGGVYLTAGAVFVMNNAPHIENCTATAAGGAVYVSPNATMAFRENPVAVIRGNAVTSTAGAGAGIYLAAPSSRLELALEYGGTISGNVVLDSAQQGRTNGGDDYQELHQDIYIAGSGDPIGSLVLTGDLAAAEGSIWVWAENANHYKTDTQFAVVKTNAAGELAFSPSAESLAVFRNARSDVETENGTDTYLYGEQGEGNQIVWSFMPDAHKVVLRKVAQDAGDGDYRMLEGATFTVYRGKSTKPFAAKNADGTKQTLKGLASDASGIFWVGDLPYGTYYLEETVMPEGSDPTERWYKLTLSEEGGMSMSKGYPERQDAANGE